MNDTLNRLYAACGVGRRARVLDALARKAGLAWECCDVLMWEDEDFCSECGKLRPGFCLDECDINRLAHLEGWTLSECSGCAEDAEPTPYQLQRLDIRPVFATDDAAWVHVYRLALAGSFLHRQALNFLAKNSPAEFVKIKTHCASLPPWPYRKESSR
jgi:hypothetical protein